MKVSLSRDKDKSEYITISTYIKDGDYSDRHQCNRLFDAIHHDAVSKGNNCLILDRVERVILGGVDGNYEDINIPIKNYDIAKIREDVKTWKAIADSDVALPLKHIEFE